MLVQCVTQVGVDRGGARVDVATQEEPHAAREGDVQGLPRHQETHRDLRVHLDVLALVELQRGGADQPLQRAFTAGQVHIDAAVAAARLEASGRHQGLGGVTVPEHVGIALAVAGDHAQGRLAHWPFVDGLQ